MLAATKQPDGLFKITDKEYDKIPALRQSLIKEIHRSPAHYVHRANTPQADAPHFALGRAVHSLVLEPDKENFAFYTGKVRRGKEWEAFQEEHAGKELLTAKEGEQAYRIRDAVYAHPVCRELLMAPGGEPEISSVWTDHLTGIRCKARFDLLKRGIIWDLKTTQDASASGFKESIEKWYLSQPGWYLDGIEAVKPNVFSRFIFMAVEKEEPFGVQLFEADRMFLARSRAYNRHALEKLQASMTTGDYPGYPLEIQAVSEISL